MNWEEIDSEESLNLLVQKQAGKPFALFKHSTRCIISSTAKNRISGNSETLNPTVPIFQVNVISSRSFSQRIAELYQLQHESPQILLIKDNKLVYHASHLSIFAKEVAKHI